MAYTYVDAVDVKPTWGTFRMIRHELGGTAFGLNQIDFPPGKVGSEHDEAESGQEEIYYCIAGSGTLTIDGDALELSPGRYVLVSPEARRQPAAGPQGMSVHLRRRRARRRLRALGAAGRVAAWSHVSCSGASANAPRRRGAARRSARRSTPPSAWLWNETSERFGLLLVDDELG